MLQFVGKKIGISVDHSPVCHAELAGEGIEYVWGLAKNKYRQSSLSEKRKVESFKNLVRTCLSRNWLTIERIRRCAMRARCYSCAYWQIRFGDSDDTAEDENLPVPIKIERLNKKYKTH